MFFILLLFCYLFAEGVDFSQDEIEIPVDKIKFHDLSQGLRLRPNYDEWTFIIGNTIIRIAEVKMLHDAKPFKIDQPKQCNSLLLLAGGRNITLFHDYAVKEKDELPDCKVLIPGRYNKIMPKEGAEEL
jgi:hypothetical protein